MSGGRFQYDQYRIREIADEIQRYLDNQGKGIGSVWEGTYPIYSDAVQEELRNAIKHLQIAYIYAHRADWLLSGDDGEENFLERLKEDLDVIHK